MAGVKFWIDKNKNGVAYSVPLPNNGDENRSAVAWVVMRFNTKAKAYHLFCLDHQDFLCNCAIEAVAFRNGEHDAA